nr:arginine--tRNA ligase, chloroplastic/mitochondrial [Tanacetum cinerariifolium]
MGLEPRSVVTMVNVTTNGLEVLCCCYCGDDEKKGDYFQLCNHKFKLDLKKFWDEKSYSKCDRLNIKGEDGRTMMYYILLKGAVDVDIALDVTSKANPPDHKVYGYIHAFYEGEISYDCHREAQDKYMALLFRSF